MVESLVKFIARAICLLSFFAIMGCGTNVLFGEQSRETARAETQGERVALDCGAAENDHLEADYTASTVRIYIDRAGDLYPSPLIDSFVSDERDKRRTLMELYAAPSGNWDVVQARAALGLSEDAGWEVLQDSLTSKAARRLEAALMDEEGDVRSLLVLIHGFNVDNPECGYATVRAALGRRIEGFAVLQVAWDGLEGGWDGRVPFFIWNKAQYNFPNAGFALRRVLRQVEEQVGSDVPIRVLTHSSGGPVVAHTFWDASASLEVTTCDRGEPPPERRRYWRRVCGERGDPPPTFADVRIGMIVPASPANIFERYDPQESRVRRVVLGVNPEDIAVNKPMWRCNWSGDTCLAVRKQKYACSSLVTTMPRRGVDIRLVDFSGSATPAKGNRTSLGLYDKHDWSIYTQRDKWEGFVAAVFDDQVAANGFESYCGEPMPPARRQGE